MAQRRDVMLEELRAIRRGISKRLLQAERREGTSIPELRRMGRAARRWARRELKDTSRNGHRRSH